MRKLFVVLPILAAVAAVPACKKEGPVVSPGSTPPSVLTAAKPAAPGPEAAAAIGDKVAGKIVEKIDTAQYSYFKVKTATGEVWAAVTKADKKVGDEIVVGSIAWMQDFKSQTLNRTWDRIAFGSLECCGGGEQGGGATAATATAQQMPAGHPPTNVAPADLADVKVARATGANARTIADIYGQKAALKGKPIVVRGKVVKATNGVMGKNWLHLRDGTGGDGTNDLTVTSTTETAKVGDTVLVSGTVTTDKDLGSGYFYDVIVEDAKIKAE